MNSLRNKLIASVTMLAVAAIMLTSASFAWYTVSIQGQITEVQVQMQAHKSIEIAVNDSEPGEITTSDSNNQKTWGSLATYTGTATLSQLATWSESKIKTAVYGTDSRISGLDEAAPVDNSATYTATTATPLLYADNTGKICAARYDFWIRTNNTGVVTVKNSATTMDRTTVVVTEVNDGGTETVKATWTAPDQTFTLNPVLEGEDGYYVTHLNMYVYVAGDTVNADDLDSGTLPSYIGVIDVTQEGVSSAS